MTATIGNYYLGFCASNDSTRKVKSGATVLRRVERSESDCKGVISLFQATSTTITFGSSSSGWQGGYWYVIDLGNETIVE